MSPLARQLVLLLIALALFTAPLVKVAAAQDTETAEGGEGVEGAEGAAGAAGTAEEDEGDEVEAENIFTTAIFPSHPDKNFPAGAVVESLIGFDNQNPSDDFRIEFIRASLTAPHDTRQFVQNFTGAADNTTVKHGTEGSFLYKFRPDVNLDPREYGIVIQVYYMNNENETFLSTVFNSTVTVTDPISEFDARTLFAYLSILAILGLAGFAVYKRASASRARAARRQQPITTGTDGIEWDFVSPTHQQFLKKRTAAPSSPKSPKSPKGAKGGK